MDKDTTKSTFVKCGCRGYLYSSALFQKRSLQVQVGDALTTLHH